MTIRARAPLLLLALLAGCIDFPDGTSFKCAAESAEHDCPDGWTCDGARCIAPEEAAGETRKACAAACEHFFECGTAQACQAESNCVLAYLDEPDVASCTDVCADDPEGKPDHLLYCYGALECHQGYDLCEQPTCALTCLVLYQYCGLRIDQGTQEECVTACGGWGTGVNECVYYEACDAAAVQACF